MIQFVIAGLVLGGISAIASAGLATTSTSSGILIFAFGATGLFVARFYYLHTQHGWAVAPAAIVSIGIASPALGVGLSSPTICLSASHLSSPNRYSKASRRSSARESPSC